MRLSLLFAASLLCFTSCKEDTPEIAVDYDYARPELPDVPFTYSNDDLPEHFNSGALQFFEFIPGNNPTTNEGSALGRVLFYDKVLSTNNTVSCGSCHHQENAFTDTRTFSPGFDGVLATRNSMSLFNKQFERRMFWDFRANTLETQVLMPIHDPAEMGLLEGELIPAVQSRDYYPALFEAAFGDDEITEERISRALAQFVRSIVSYQSKYDVGAAAEFANFTEQELLGKELYYDGDTRCNQCHLTSNFYGPAAENNGLDLEYEDDGLGAGRFKIPSLRNIAMTAPYMHDGRFETLEEVMDHYNGNVAQHYNLSDQLTTDFITGGEPIQPNLSADEIAAMIAFFHTLSDFEMIVDPRWSDPFK